MAQEQPEGRWTAILTEINHCNKCGFCLPSCPTYRLTGQELHSPRGRIAMVEAAARGELEQWSALEEALTYCVACRNCETACPSGVHYARILEAGREFLRARHSRAFRGSFAAQQALRLAKYPGRLRGLVRLARRLTGVPLPGAWARFRAMLPPEPRPLPAGPPPRAARRGTLLWFDSCVMAAVFEEANRATQALLNAAGWRVVTVPRQTCCGAIHLHSGERAQALALARQNVAALEAAVAQYGAAGIVHNAGGCGAMLTEYPQVLAEDPAWAARAQRLAGLVQDFTALLWGEEGPLLPFQGNGERVALQNSCHLVNVAKAGQAPVRLLESVEGDTYVPYYGQEICCGSGGVYNLNHTDWALGILDQKMRAVATVHPTRIVVNNPGCHLQMQWGARRHPEVGAEVEHLATYLWRSYVRAAARASSEATAMEGTAAEGRP